MKILVTGGAGFIGSNLVDALSGHDVTVLDNFSTGHKGNLINFRGEVIKGNVEDVQLDGHYDVIFHTAALARIQPSIIDPVRSHKANVLGTLNMLLHARKWGSRFVYSSSSSVYGGDKTMPLIEKMPANPGSPYALQKYTGEEYCRIFHELFKMHIVSLRYFNVYGERQLTEGAYATAIGIFLKQFRGGKAFTIFGDGEQRRDFTYVKDVVKANIDAVNVAPGVYNVGTGRNYSVNEVTKLISENHPSVHLPAKQGEYPATLASTAKFSSVFGWQPETKLEDWIKNL